MTPCGLFLMDFRLKLLASNTSQYKKSPASQEYLMRNASCHCKKFQTLRQGHYKPDSFRNQVLYFRKNLYTAYIVIPWLFLRRKYKRENEYETLNLSLLQTVLHVIDA